MSRPELAPEYLRQSYGSWILCGQQMLRLFRQCFKEYYSIQCMSKVEPHRRHCVVVLEQDACILHVA